MADIGQLLKHIRVSRALQLRITDVNWSQTGSIYQVHCTSQGCDTIFPCHASRHKAVCPRCGNSGYIRTLLRETIADRPDISTWNNQEHRLKPADPIRYYISQRHQRGTR